MSDIQDRIDDKIADQLADNFIKHNPSELDRIFGLIRERRRERELNERLQTSPKA
jgi:hypothetical protein